MNKLDELLRSIEAGPSSEGLANHYATEDPAIDLPGGAAIRRDNLRKYLGIFLANAPRITIVGEAPGYRGCRFSGIPFTSEYVLQHHAELKNLGLRRSSCRARPWSEASATIVWETFDKLGSLPLLWVTVPFHCHQPGDKLTNRTPRAAEILAGFDYFTMLRRVIPSGVIVAAGRIASDALTKAGIRHESVRHPAHGGKREFQQQLLRIGRKHCS